MQACGINVVSILINLCLIPMSFRLLKQLDFPSMKFSLYFMGYENAEDIPRDEKERMRWVFTRRATLELT